MFRLQSPPSSVSQVSANETPPGSPMGALMDTVSRFFYMSPFTCLCLHVSRVLQIKRNFTLLLKALGKERLPMFPKRGSLWKQMSISRVLLSISFRVPSKGALPTGSAHRVPTERDALFPETSFIHLSKSLVHEPPSRLPSRTPMERDARLQSLPLHNLQIPLTELP